MEEGLRRLAVAVLLVFAGCAGFGTPTNDTTASTTGVATPPEFDDIGSVTVAPGDSARVTVNATNVGELHVRERGPADVSLSVESLTPQPDRVVDTMAPYYVWDQAQSSVVFVVSVEATPDAEPGTYQFDIVAWNHTDHSHTNGTTGTLTVTVSEQ